ncbi:DUF1961 family protein [candidate division KSB1 bacterium]|nr:DUF1961 family protein [candidate division KSB1 bacterium]
MPLEYNNLNLLHEDNFAELKQWHHEGAGSIHRLEKGGMQLQCFGSQQGGPGCMAFFSPNLPDQISISYEIVVHRHGGLVINYVAIRGLNGEDLITDADQLAPRTGEMKNYFALKWGLQSYHVSFSRFDDLGQHTNTSNWRRNPGSLLVGHGNDLVKELHQRYRIRITKDEGILQLFVNDVFAHGVIDRDQSRYPIPDTGKFGFRLIGSDVSADVSNLRIHRIEPHSAPRRNSEGAV